ncbi:MAG: NADH-ubiquinone oxidoreductase-F iron-sulfur binding region domain-containing protein [Spirochaetota bacterium]
MLKNREQFQELQRRCRDAWRDMLAGPAPVVTVGTATCGRSAGSLEVLEALRERFGEQGIQATVMEVGCIGLCYAEPLVAVLKPDRPAVLYGHVDPERAGELASAYLERDDPLPRYALGSLGYQVSEREGGPFRAGGGTGAPGGAAALQGITPLHQTDVLKPQVRRVMRKCGVIDPDNIQHYIAADGYAGAARALFTGPGDIIAELKQAALRGRGGAGFPTALKWEIAHSQPAGTKYVVCNADEGDPGAFMNRSVLEGDPHAVLEGMLIAGHTIGAGTGYIYCRAEYPLALERLRNAIRQAEEYGLLGDDILGTGFSFHVKIKEGAGAFVCGEETALLASIEGRRGMPTTRPPYPVVSGLWGRPTVINNVETLASTALVFQNDAQWYARYGTETSKGTKTFSLAGKVRNTGLIEVPLGITLREIIFQVGGGIPGDKRFKAVQTGGPSGGCIPESLLDTPVDYDSLKQAGAIMGSGGMIVMDEDTCMVDVARYFLDFTQKESCGECVPCRLGTRQMLDILEDICAGKGEPGDVELLEELALGIKTGSLCGLGQTAPNPVLTTIRYFRDEYEAHIRDRQCPSLVCKALIHYRISADRCIGCRRCFKTCPVDAISGEPKKTHVIDQDTCIRCGLCRSVCPVKENAVEVHPGRAPEQAASTATGGGK